MPKSSMMLKQRDLLYKTILERYFFVLGNLLHHTTLMNFKNGLWYSRRARIYLARSFLYTMAEESDESSNSNRKNELYVSVRLLTNPQITNLGVGPFIGSYLSMIFMIRLLFEVRI